MEPTKLFSPNFVNKSQAWCSSGSASVSIIGIQWLRSVNCDTSILLFIIMTNDTTSPLFHLFVPQILCASTAAAPAHVLWSPRNKGSRSSLLLRGKMRRSSVRRAVAPAPLGVLGNTRPASPLSGGSVSTCPQGYSSTCARAASPFSLSGGCLL